MHADQIIMLDQGQIADIGTHQQLLTVLPATSMFAWQCACRESHPRL